MAFLVRHGLFIGKGHSLLVQAVSLRTTQSSMAISLFTVWVPTMFCVCQALSVLIFCVVFWIFVGYLSVIFSIFLHGYKETCSYFTNRKFLVTIGD